MMVTLVGDFLSRVLWRSPQEEQRMRGDIRHVSSSRMPIRRLAIACLLFVVAFLAVSLSSTAQTPSAGPRILAPINGGAPTTLRGNTHPLARAEFDQGKVESAMPMRVTIAFKMTAAQQADLDALLASQQDRGSPDYQRWLTPEQFGRRFGLSQADVNKVTGWLQSEGFQVEPLPASHNMITFRGTAQQVEAALHTEMHHYAVNGKAHFANASDPSVPAALADVVSGVRGLNNFQLKPRAMRKVSPRFTSGQTGNHFIAPGDFATIYDEAALYAEGFNGTGQKIVVVGQSDIQLSDIAAFRNNSGLPANPPQIVHVPGDADPGMRQGDIDEANLDVEWAGATAPMATVIFIVGDPINGGGVFDSLQYAITSQSNPRAGDQYELRRLRTRVFLLRTLLSSRG